MSNRPKWPFTLAHDDRAAPDTVKPEPTIRDKDNAQLRLDPPNKEQAPRFDLAPAGAMGVKRGLKTPEHQKAKRFNVKPGALAPEFKTANRNRGPDHDRDR